MRLRDATKEEAAQLIARGRLTYLQIAERVHVGERTLYRWLKNDGFQRRVVEILSEYAARATKTGLALKANRVAELTEQYNLLAQLIASRAADTRFHFIPNYNTGLVSVTMLEKTDGPLLTSPTHDVQAGQDASGGNGLQVTGPEILPANDSGLDAQGQTVTAILNTGGKLRVKYETDHRTLAAMRDILGDVAAECGQRESTLNVRNITDWDDLSEADLNALLKRLDRQLEAQGITLPHPSTISPDGSETIQ